MDRPIRPEWPASGPSARPGSRWVRSFWRSYGLIRSLLIYYGVPLRIRALANLYAELVAPGDLCFDLGAHVGNHTRALRRLGARVVAVEPQPLFYQVLQRQFGKDPEVCLVQRAVGARPGLAQLLLSARTPTVATLSVGWATQVARSSSFARVRWEEQRCVRVTNLDSLIRRFGVPVFCKIDVEGLEEAVLKGLTRAVPVLSFEFIPAFREGGLTCLQLLQALGPYQLNCTLGERHQWVLNHWSSAPAMADWLRRRPLNSRPVAVYARLPVEAANEVTY